MTMKVLSYTRFFSTERKIYAFGDLNLPFPISFKQIGLFLAVGLPWFGLMALVNLPLSNWLTAVIWFGVPIGLTALGNKKLLENKSFFEYFESQIKFLFEPKDIYDGKADNTIGKTYRVEANVWWEKKDVADGADAGTWTE